MEKDTLLSAEAEDSEYPPTRRFFAPDETPLAARHPGLIAAEWSWHEISQEEWHQLPERLRLLRIELATRAPVSIDGDASSDPDNSKPGKIFWASQFWKKE